MADKPIIFSGAMVNAILAGRKSMTRRVLKPQRGVTISDTVATGKNIGVAHVLEVPREKLVAPYAPGDLLWVRETFQIIEGGPIYDAAGGQMDHAETEIYYRATTPEAVRSWRSPIHMPRWASRITLRVTDVRVQRLQDISAADSIAEGVQCQTCAAMQSSACGGKGCFASLQAFSDLWATIHGPGSWDQNPWVAAITFERVE